MNRFVFSTVAAVLIALLSTAQGADKLNDEQRNALGKLASEAIGAQEEIQKLRTGKMRPADLGWDYYKQWFITPTQKALEEARKAKIPADATCFSNGHDWEYSKLEAMAASVESDFKAAFALDPNDRVAQFKAAQKPEIFQRYEAFKAEMAKVLSGDKLKIMNDDILLDGVLYTAEGPKFLTGYYGEGKKLLTKPEDFAAAKIWATSDYVYASGDTLKTDPHWRVYVYQFDGMKLAKKIADRGPGKVAPDSYFQAPAK